jgi:DNA repair exonuclease SbcCD nuclease subunit
MRSSCLAPNFYVHPDYLLGDQVLDQIGKHIIRGWNSDCIEASKITRQLSLPHRGKQYLTGTEIAYLTPLQEVAIYGELNNFKSTRQTQARQPSPLPSPFGEFLRKGYVTQTLESFCSENVDKAYRDRTLKRLFAPDGFMATLAKEGSDPEPTGETQGHLSCNTAFLLRDTAPSHERASTQASNFDIALGTVTFSANDLEHEQGRIELKNLLTLTKVRNVLRDALARGDLCPYIKDQYFHQPGYFTDSSSYLKKEATYLTVSPTGWGSEAVWCRFLIEGFQGKPVGGLEGMFAGRLFFKKAEVKSFLEDSVQPLLSTDIIDDQENKESLERLFDPNKPWLKLMNEIALSLSNEEVETKTKKELIRDIEKKANSSGLAVTPKKLEYLATFLRSLEQEKGTTWRSKNAKAKP